MFRLFSRSPKVLKIQASWDEEAQVWYVFDSDVPGLHAEAETQEGLLEVLKDLIPELIKANIFSLSGGEVGSEVPIELIAHRKEMLSMGC